MNEGDDEVKFIASVLEVPSLILDRGRDQSIWVLEELVHVSVNIAGHPRHCRNVSGKLCVKALGLLFSFFLLMCHYREITCPYCILRTGGLSIAAVQ